MKHIALVRGINVGGNNMVKMADLKAILTDLGFNEPRTLLQSGNMVFGSMGLSALELEEKIEAAAKKQLGLTALFYVRTAQEWADLIAGNPFPNEAAEYPGRLLVHFFKESPSPEGVEAVASAIRGPERIAAEGRHLYVVYPEGIGVSTIGKTPGWNKLISTGSGRNWNTILKLAAL